MLSWAFLPSDRGRRIILGLGSAVAVGYPLAGLRRPMLIDRTFTALASITIILMLLSVVLLARRRPRAFDVRPGVPAFTAPGRAAYTCMTLGQLAMVMTFAGIALRGVRPGESLTDAVLLALLALLMVPGVLARWRGTGLELRPDGLRDRAPLGSLTVPWEALPVVPLPEPGDRRNTLRVRYAHPELVRRRGLVVGRKELATDTVDPRLAAQVIRYYVTHPERRPAIGTQAEYDRLRAEIDGPPSA